MTGHISLHAAARHEVRIQASVADALRTATRRYQAAIELERARQAVRDAGPLVTDNLRWRQGCAEAVWDTLQITDWQVTA